MLSNHSHNIFILDRRVTELGKPKSNKNALNMKNETEKGLFYAQFQIGASKLMGN